MLTIGSRGSKLALWQANHIQAALAQAGHKSRVEVIQTSGDRFQSGPLKEIGNKGLFTKEIEEALLDRSIDIAVHSLKDMPTELPAGLRIAATPEREDPRDVLIGATLDQLPRGAKVGTGSLRRIAQLAAARPDLKLMPIRGNVDTRLRKLDGKEFDAIVLAAAGLRRLGWAERITEYLPVEVMCPAVGQGALAIETRADGEAAEICAALNHPETNAAVSAERALLGVLGGGCQVPVGAHASVTDAKLTLRAVVISTDGRAIVRQFTEGSVEEAERIGRLCGEALLESGAAEILEAVYGS